MEPERSEDSHGPTRANEDAHNNTVSTELEVGHGTGTYATVRNLLKAM